MFSPTTVLNSSAFSEGWGEMMEDKKEGKHGSDDQSGLFLS